MEGNFIDHYPVRLRFATARHPFASEGDYCATASDEGEFYSARSRCQAPG
ncbi:MAG: hypothetical protein LBB23_01095 [Rickettsiales bacterium]|nr:hypothetical protein [Rickettsiales bacterium]